MTRTFWLACLLALGISSFPLSAAARDGRVLSIQGAATVNGTPMRRSTSINGGDRIDTQAGSRVKIIMNDGTVLEIGPDTAFKVESFSYRKAEPSSWTSSFSLLRGAMRYVSGLIAKRDSKKVRIGAGTATIGIRGTFASVTFDGVTVTSGSSLGETTITFPGGAPLVVPTGSLGTLNTNTGQGSTNTLPDNDTTRAARAIAAAPGNKDGVKAALAGKSAEEQALIFAVLINNAAALGVTDTSTLTDAVGAAAEGNPEAAALLVFVATALDPDNADAYVSKATQGAPGQKSKIEAAAAAGVDQDADFTDEGGGSGNEEGDGTNENVEENPSQDTEPGVTPSPTEQEPEPDPPAPPPPS